MFHQEGLPFPHSPSMSFDGFGLKEIIDLGNDM